MQFIIADSSVIHYGNLSTSLAHICYFNGCSEGTPSKALFRIHLKISSPCKFCYPSYRDGHTKLSFFCKPHQLYHFYDR
jgi:hypothetical protein